MKRLVLSAMLASSLLALSARESRADGFSFDLHLSGSASFNCWSGCGPGYGSCGPCPPCYNFGPCFAPAFSTLGYGAPPAGYYDRIGYPGYPGTPMGYPQAAYGYPSAAPSYAPGCSRQRPAAGSADGTAGWLLSAERLCGALILVRSVTRSEKRTARFVPMDEPPRLQRTESALGRPLLSGRCRDGRKCFRAGGIGVLKERGRPLAPITEESPP